jgi:hypothetical protein
MACNGHSIPEKCGPAKGRSPRFPESARLGARNASKGDREPEAERTSDPREGVERHAGVCRVHEAMHDRPARAHGRCERGKGDALPLQALANLLGQDFLLRSKLDRP